MGEGGVVFYLLTIHSIRPTPAPTKLNRVKIHLSSYCISRPLLIGLYRNHIICVHRPISVFWKSWLFAEILLAPPSTENISVDLSPFRNCSKQKPNGPTARIKAWLWNLSDAEDCAFLMTTPYCSRIVHLKITGNLLHIQEQQVTTHAMAKHFFKRAF